MWNCKSCRMSFAFESVEQHVYGNHLKPNVGKIKVYNCGECKFVAEGFESIALHCIDLGHEPTRVYRGLGYNEYAFQLFSALEDSMCLMSKPSALQTFASSAFLTASLAADVAERGTPISYINWSEPGYEPNTEISHPQLDADDNEPVRGGLEAEEDKGNSLSEVSKIESAETNILLPKDLVQTPSTSKKSSAKGALITKDSVDSSRCSTERVGLEGNMMKKPTDVVPRPLPSPIVVSDDDDGKNKKSYSCAFCPKTCGTVSAAKLHRRIHTGEKPFQCQTCGQSFARKDALHVHKRTHTGEKPYRCTTCGNSFNQRNNLTTHQRTHSGVKPFSCSVCRRSFTKSDNLKTHQRVHTGEKAYRCALCGKGFNRALRMKSHQETNCSLNLSSTNDE